MDSAPVGTLGTPDSPRSAEGHAADTAISNSSQQQSISTSDVRVGVFANITNTLSSSLKWCPTSEHELAQAESDLFAVLTRPFKAYFVNIGQGWGLDKVRVRTLEMLTDEEIKDAEARNSAIGTDQQNESSINKAVANSDVEQPAMSQAKKAPIVLVHGFAAGIGTWILNLDPLASTLDRKVYALDLVGFARSTRAPFDLSGDVEGQFVDSIERWRKKVGIDKFILLGHSFGGYLCGSYALKHPENVAHVILADPWGVQDRQASGRRIHRLPIWVRVVNSIFQSFNPLAVLRASGPYGPSLVHKFRADLKEKFRPKLDDDCHKFLNYIYHCNAQSATGESAFKELALPYGWPKNPLIHRLLDLNEAVSLTFIYGSRSWIEKAPGEFLRDCMKPGRVTVIEIEGSGHHVYADKYNQFNEHIQEACSKVKD